jgi:hypothetical protein
MRADYARLAWLMANTAMCCAALLLRVIKRMGKWLKDAKYVNYLAFFNTEGLMAMGCWPHAVKKDSNYFWHERFECNVSQELMHPVFPFLPELKLRLEEVGTADPSMDSIIQVLEYLAVVLVQDAVELLAELKFAEHPVHQHLMVNDKFR